MLTLVPTDPGWATLALSDPEALFSDHAHCERKAAQQAMSLLHAVNAYPDVVLRLARLAEQEAEHLRRVIEMLAGLGLHLRLDQPNHYAQRLAASAADTIDRLIVAALVEARSHERLSLLRAELVNHPTLGHLESFYAELCACEAGHASNYLTIAERVVGPDRVGARVERWIEREAVAIRSVEPRSAIH